jgi:aconitate hydratase
MKGAMKKVSLGLSGRESYSVIGLGPLSSGEVPKEVTVSADGREFSARPRIDTPMEAAYYRHSGILHYVLRDLVQAGAVENA